MAGLRAFGYTVLAGALLIAIVVVLVGEFLLHGVGL